MSHQPPDPIRAKVLPGHPFFDLIEEAYRVFTYPKPIDTGVCKQCCMDREIEADFFNPPIRELPLRYLQDWFFAAYDLTTMPKETWGYLLPRVLEILAAGEHVASNGLEVSLSRFDTGNPDRWSPRQWTVLDEFQRSFLRHTIDHTQDALDDVLCLFKLGGWPLASLQEQVINAPVGALVQRLWRDWCGSSAPGRECIWTTTFSPKHDRSRARAFYTSRDLHDRLMAFAFDDDTDANLCARACAVLEVIEMDASWQGPA
ncbi:hypothetical protein [Zavarzinia sp. CC-PAN008]|uniref:hypothetical protein n=1 Tax=Zavarzinia sp. CC-PAN008 TaxID=3243332 RepID=UPI003F749D8D